MQPMTDISFETALGERVGSAAGVAGANEVIE
jgi:hypothetical protein